MKVFDVEGYENRRLGFWCNLGRVWLLVQVNGKKFV